MFTTVLVMDVTSDNNISEQNRASTAHSTYSKNKLGQFLQACFLILVRDLRSDVIPASFTSSNCVHYKSSIFNEYLQQCTPKFL